MYNSSTQQSLTASLLEQKLLSNHMAACFINLKKTLLWYDMSFSYCQHGLPAGASMTVYCSCQLLQQSLENTKSCCLPGTKHSDKKVLFCHVATRNKDYSKLSKSVPFLQWLPNQQRHNGSGNLTDGKSL